MANDLPPAVPPAGGFDVAAAALSQTITLSFVTQADLGSWAIRQFDHGSFSHVDCILPDGRYLGARDDLIAGVPRGVQIRPPAYAPFSRQLQIVLHPPPEICRPFYLFLHDQLGKAYDATGLVGNFIVDRDWRTPDSWWCSELHGAALEQGVLIRPLETPLNKLTPDGLSLVAQGLAWRYR